jgi:hypothetical protein
MKPLLNVSLLLYYLFLAAFSLAQVKKVQPEVIIPLAEIYLDNPMP